MFFNRSAKIAQEKLNAEQAQNLKRQVAELEAKLSALDKSQAVIEFSMDGSILAANDNFLQTVGYRLDEIVGQHHRIFMDKEEAQSPEYAHFWQQLNRGEFVSAEFKRMAKGNREIWIQASYNPIFDDDGKPAKVVKYATDITEQKMQAADFRGQIDAIGKSLAVIEFEPDGTIIHANENFLKALGYSQAEVVGKHHRIFVEADYRNSPEYSRFWQELKNGVYSSGEYKRIAKDGSDVWIQASYNPILDLNGQTIKVVKYATDITQQKLLDAYYKGQIDAIGKSQAVIEFDINGIIEDANENFLSALGYSLDEIKGQHHSLFVESGYKNSPEYKSFWHALSKGEFKAGEFKRLGKGGKVVWIQASYNPIVGLNGEVLKVVKYATDITSQKMLNANFQGQIEAIGKSQAVIEFNMDGTIIGANENFLSAMGYQLDEIKGHHHSLFIEAGVRETAEYKQFWQSLNRGDFDSGEYKRIGKGGKEVWIQASYNPIMDANGKPFKVVKYATDVSARKYAVKEISQSLMSLSQGDLSNLITVPLEGEFDELKEAINSTIERFSDMVSQIRTSANFVSTSANEIQTGTADLSQRTESQAASLEETSSSVEELTQTVNQNADNAKSAVSLAAEANQKATVGGEVVNQAVVAMRGIGGASKKIADIISVIDEIAFQTNLLALNAAVEAARAGEQGRGFAVVADEVRSLAQRTQSSAQEIETLVTSLQNSAGDSVSAMESSTTMASFVTFPSLIAEIGSPQTKAASLDCTS